LRESLSKIGPGLLFDRTDRVVLQEKEEEKNDNSVVTISKYEEAIAEQSQRTIESNETLRPYLYKIEDTYDRSAGVAKSEVTYMPNPNVSGAIDNMPVVTIDQAGASSGTGITIQINQIGSPTKHSIKPNCLNCTKYGYWYSAVR
jgi:hypothetical protein